MKLNKSAIFFAIFGITALIAKATSPDSTIVNHIMADAIIVVEQPDALTARLKTGKGAEKKEEPATSEIKNDVIKVNVSGREENVASAQESSASSSTLSGGTGTLTKTAGYRVLVFSDGNARTAKNEARSKAQNISSRLPKYRTYVTYTSPYWRLKVGDFLTRQEAENAADEIKKVFPAYAREVRVVTDRVNVAR